MNRSFAAILLSSGFLCCSGTAFAAKDVLTLRDGSSIAGEVTNVTLRLRTSYAGLQLQTRSLDSIDFGSGPQELAVVTTANSNRLTGFLESDALGVVPDTGSPLQVRKERVSRIVFGNPTTNAPPAEPATWLRLKNGDVLSGRVQPELTISVTNAALSLPLKEVRLLTTHATAAPTTCRIYLNAGGMLDGVLGSDYLVVALEIGPQLEIYAGSIERLGTAVAVVSSSPDGLPAGDPSTAAGGAKPAPPGLPGLVWIPPGEFTMGSKYDEKGRDLDEGPPTRITITHGFWIGRCEVTQAEYEKVLAANPSNSTDDPNLPVEKVSWTEAMEYCARLTASTRAEGRLPEGYAFRLPTEGEWEYACRAGTTTRFSCGDDLDDSVVEAFAWTARNSNFRTNPVGKKKPNAWGLHDMHGNVWEWCLDRWERSLPGGSQTNKPSVPAGGLRAARGGSWLYDAKSCRSANRDDYSPSNRCSDIGFRVVLAPEL